MFPCLCVSPCHVMSCVLSRVRSQEIQNKKPPRYDANQLARPWHRFLNVKVLAGTFNQEKALVGAFSVIVKTDAMDRLKLYSLVRGFVHQEPGGLVHQEGRVAEAVLHSLDGPYVLDLDVLHTLVPSHTPCL